MRIACVSIPHFYVQVERLKRPETWGRPVIIGGRPDERAPVIDCSEEAGQRGVRASLSLKEAYHLCPDALFVRFDEEESRVVWEEAVSMLQSFSMRIEIPGAGTAYLDITRRLSIYKDEEALAARIVREMEERFRLKAKTGIGNSLFVARMAASAASPHTRVVPAGKEKQFVSPLPAGSLPVDEDIKERLGLLGLHRLGRIASIPMNALIAQFGRPGRLIWELSNGQGEERPFPRVEGRICPEREMTSEAPIEVMERLRAPLEGAVGQIAEELAAMKRLCRAVKLVLYLRNGESLERQWIMHVPASSGEEILGRIMDGLGTIALKSPITGFRVSAPALSPRECVPDTLFRTRILHGERLTSVKDYLKTKYGGLPLVRVEEKGAGARLPERRFVFVEI